VVSPAVVPAGCRCCWPASWSPAVGAGDLAAVLVASLGCAALKLAGWSLPPRWLEGRAAAARGRSAAGRAARRAGRGADARRRRRRSSSTRAWRACWWPPALLAARARRSSS
jgi:hypothetical protein